MLGRSRAQGTREDKDSRVFNVYKERQGEDSPESNRNVLYNSRGGAGEKEGPQNPHLSMYNHNLHSSPHL